MRGSWAGVVGLCAALCGLTACGGDGGKSDVSVGDVADTTPGGDVADVPAVPDLVADLQPDVAVDQVVPPDVPVVPDIVESVDEVSQDPCAGSSCPEGFCEEGTGYCLYCDAEQACAKPGTWCKDGTCVQTLCIPGVSDCASLTDARTCDEDGESYTPKPCGEGMGCNSGECMPIICQGGERKCGTAGMLKICSPNGVAWVPTSCPPGQACTSGECRPLQHNLLVIFDTSSSMMSLGTLDAVPCICESCTAQPYPACEDSQCPLSKLGLSKHVFAKFFDSVNIGAVNLVLTHFPMKIKYPPVTSCNNLFAMGRGYYGKGMSDSDFITGDDGSHETVDGGWFDQNLFEILCVPFPKDSEEDNLGKAKLWVDFDEQVGPTETPCSVMADCPGGFCADNEGSKVCWYHTNPELRSVGNTPLGRSMFYAGELYRKTMVIDGKSCTTTADCGNENYYCTTQGKCKDPYASCRVNMILLFTDGEEEPATSTMEFFNPRVQAKRFRYGLGCESDSECFEGATCDGGMCKGYPHPNGGPSSFPGNTEDPGRLMRYDGVPIQVTTHVIDMSGSGGSSNNRGISDDGGGSYYVATDADPDAMLGQLLSLVDVKENLQGCVPDYTDIAPEAE